MSLADHLIGFPNSPKNLTHVHDVITLGSGQPRRKTGTQSQESEHLRGFRASGYPKKKLR